MEINSYNDESKHKKLVEDLKSLPKIKAPENFEYNLMTRIQNQNFGDVKKERLQFNVIKFLAPSAVVVTAFIIFFLFFSTSQQQIDNPFMVEPPAIVSDSQATIASSKNELALNESKSAAESPERITEPRIKKEDNISPVERIQLNDAVIKKQSKYPINTRRSVALDDFISGDSRQKSTLERGNIVNNGEETTDFDGFYIRQEPDKATITKYRSLIDSVKKAQMKADSSKRARK